MRTIYVDLRTQQPQFGASVATVGFFDGVHRGHQFLLAQQVAEARTRGLGTTVVTFGRHPRQVVQADFRPQLLTTLDEKARLLSAAGVDCLAVLQFDAAMAALSAREFMDRILRRQLNAEVLLTGYDNRFGHNREEGFEDYVRYGEELGMAVVQEQPFTADGLKVSSSVVRRLVGEGDVARAAVCLGRYYELGGRVVRGEHVGTGLGFPTANVEPGDAQKLIPAAGVYAVWATLADGRRLPAMMNIGTRPTFGGQDQTLEVHVLGFDGNLYGQPVTVAFCQRMRGETCFASPGELAAQLAKDREQARHILNVQ